MPKGNPHPSNGFKKGKVANPTGKNGFTSGFEPFHKRAEYLLGKYTLEQIVEIAADRTKLVTEVSSWDGLVMRRLAAMADGRADERAELALLLDRKEGKAVDRRDVRVIRSMKDLTEEELEALATTGD